MILRPKTARGFTLVEVLVALAVLALALMAALRASSIGVANSSEIRDRLLASWVAQNQLAEHRARRDWLAVGVYHGNAVEGGMQFRWEEKVSSTPNTQFLRVEIRVFAQDRPAGALGTMSGFLVRPER
ncbi:MAG TPA: type II secretion system minor pseudopilin GspI [Burkholderiales bacterium]|nr:type II secretion system minor pseudopilin GspI [Burkholderiales bacterium]